MPVVDKLEARGLVSRRSSSADHRVNGLWLTLECSVLLRTLEPPVLGHEQRLMQRLTRAEREQLFELLSRITAGTHCATHKPNKIRRQPKS